MFAHRFPVLVLFFCCGIVCAETVELDGRVFEIPIGYRLTRATTVGLTERPIVVDFDHAGHLFVAESSGTNDKVEKQLADKPHSILRLTDTDNDGVFDHRTTFADRMMLPEGILCFRGSVYVSAPPQIWKLTDTNDDGVADEREVWFDAKTLTGCANDLHGPYLGVDGWIYWCKGAFAEQTYPRENGDSFVTRAAHIFRRRPEGGRVEPVMTGGMDNPVEVAFTKSGERIFTTTFFQHPENGRRDGLVHAIYGGVYGKQHGVIDGHARTGDLMPVLTHLGAAAPSGLARLESETFGFRDQLLTACFNLHSVTRHELIAKGATYETVDSELVRTDDLDFHPTDVVEDADGSVLIIDTGGWYKLCCPTSQLHKPDVSGGIYRLKRVDAAEPMDPRGKSILWSELSPRELGDLLGDKRFAVRRKAIDRLALLGARKRTANQVVATLREILAGTSSTEQRRNAIWCACRIQSTRDAANEVVRVGLVDRSQSVRQAAAHAAGIWRDAGAADLLLALLDDASQHVQRAAAEAIGRIGSRNAIAKLLSKLDDDDIDRTLEHSLIYALIEINSAVELKESLVSGSIAQQRAALLAKHGMIDGELSPEEVGRFLVHDDEVLRTVAIRIALEHPEWERYFAELFRRSLRTERMSKKFVEPIGELASGNEVAKLLVELLNADSVSMESKIALLESARNSRANIDSALLGLLSSEEPKLVASAVRFVGGQGDPPPSVMERLKSIVKSKSTDHELRLLAARKLPRLDSESFHITTELLAAEQPARLRSMAVGVLENVELTASQLFYLAGSVEFAGPLEVGRLLQLFQSTSDIEIGKRLLKSLAVSEVAASVPAEQVAKLADQFGDETVTIAKSILANAAVDPAEQSNQLSQMLSKLPRGDIRRGQKLFHDQKLACFTCHTIGYRGGKVGPDLSRIGRTRSRRDLLEAILFPSASFVRSYEPVTVLTGDGRQWAGTIRNQSSKSLELQLNATETKTLEMAAVEQVLPGKVSIMPAGLDKQLSNEELADLLAFLESRK